MSILPPSQYQYQQDRKMQKELQALPLSARKEGMRDFMNLLRDLEALIARADWLLSGDYGYVPHYQFSTLTKRMNRVAWIGQQLAMRECNTTPEMARKAWHALDAEAKQSANDAIMAIIEQWEANHV